MLPDVYTFQVISRWNSNTCGLEKSKRLPYLSTELSACQSNLSSM